MRILLRWLPVILLFAVCTPAEGQKHCRKGIPCGNSCISPTKTCHIASAKPAPDSVARGPAQADTAQTGPWVASSRGKVYYRSTCSVAKKLSVRNRVYFPSEDAAKKAGYRRSATKGC